MQRCRTLQSAARECSAAVALQGAAREALQGAAREALQGAAKCVKKTETELYLTFGRRYRV